MIAANGVPTYEKCMQIFRTRPEVLRACMCGLSNAMYISDENKLLIGQACGDEIVDIIFDHASHLGLFKMAMRALGNLSVIDENVDKVIRCGATRAIVAGMRHAPGEGEAMLIAVQVMGNFASAAEAIDEKYYDEPDGEEKMIAHIMFKEEAGPEVISVLNRSVAACEGHGGVISFRSLAGKEKQLLYACIEALNFICHTTFVADALVPFGCCTIAAKSFRGAVADADVALLDPIVALLATLAYGDLCAMDLAIPSGGEKGVIEEILATLLEYPSQSGMLHNCMITLNLMVRHPPATSLYAAQRCFRPPFPPFPPLSFPLSFPLSRSTGSQLVLSPPFLPPSLPPSPPPPPPLSLSLTHTQSQDFDAAKIIRDENGLDTICNKCLRDYIEEDDFITEALGCLGRMAQDAELCYQIAQECLDEVVLLIGNKMANHEMLVQIFKVRVVR